MLLDQSYWRFRPDPADEGEAARWFATPLTAPEVHVPHVWNVVAGTTRYEGSAWYQREVAIPPWRGIVHLEFEGFYGAITVWLDDLPVARRSHGYTPLHAYLVVDEPRAWEGRLTVRLDNRVQPDEISEHGGFVRWGGLHRPVRLTLLPPRFVHHCKFTSRVNVESVGRALVEGEPVDAGAGGGGRTGEKLGDWGEATVSLDVEVAEFPGRTPPPGERGAKPPAGDLHPGTLQAVLTPEGAPGGKDETTLACTAVTPVDGPARAQWPEAWDLATREKTAGRYWRARLEATGRFALWNPAQPLLYRLHVRLAPRPDEWSALVGVREVGTNTRGHLLLNGRRVLFLGVNRHDEHPVFGPALPPALTRHDLTLMKEAHMTGFRPAHYPARETTLAAADRVGLMVMEEVPHYIMSVAQLQDPRVLETGRAMFREMIRAHWNHPCVVAWSMANECKADRAETKAMLRALVAIGQELDPSRLLHFTGYPSPANVAETGATLVGINVYYGASTNKMGTDVLPGVLDSLRTIMAEDLDMARVPLLVTEFGSQAVAGYHDIHPYHGNRDDASPHTRFTEERQAQVLADFVETTRSREFVAGLLVWCWRDNRYEPGVTSAGEVMRYGLLDWHGTPKLAYHVLARLYAGRLEALEALDSLPAPEHN